MARKPADQSVNPEEIIYAAADILARHGYEATTMKDIAAQVNLTAASLYHHFRNKDMLVLAVLETGLDRVITQIEPIVHSDMSYADKLREMMKVHIQNVTEHRSVGAAMVFEIRSLMSYKPPPGKGYQHEVYQEFVLRRDAFFVRRDYFERLFRQVVEAGVNAGEFIEVDEALFVKSILGAHNWVGVWYKDGGRLSAQTIAATMAETFIRSLRCSISPLSSHNHHS